MAFFGKIKKVFGFSDTDYEEEENSESIRSAAVTPISMRRKESMSETDDLQNQPDSSATLPDQVIPEMPETVPEDIFKTVVRIFNDTLPDFLKATVDEKSQREYIYNSLDSSMKDYLADLNRIAEKRTEIAWHDERIRLKIEMENLQHKAKQIEDSSAEWKEQKLSAERQKRALSERVHDLEKQIAAFEAEKEQYELENKSLVNKLRASSIQEGDIEALNQENARLREELVKAKTSTELTTDTAEAERTIKKLSDENLSLKNDVELLKKRCEIADAMINDLNHRASTAQKSLTEKDSLLSEIQAELAKIKAESHENSDSVTSEELQKLKETNEGLTEENLKLSSDLEKAGNEVDKIKTELEESRESLRLFEESLDKFEQVKNAKDAQISTLQGQLKSTELDLEAKNNEISSLRSTIENNLKLQASSEAILRQEIENLKSSGDYVKTKRRRKNKISSIDESLDDTDWLIATPPEGTNARPSGVPDSEFGYQEPKRKENPPEDSAQMLLW